MTSHDEMPAPTPPGFTFGHGVALWQAIVDQVGPSDPAGSWLVGPARPDQPVIATRGMFDLVPVGALA